MRTNRALPLLLPALLVLLALPLTGCKDFSFFGVLGDRIDDTPLQIAPPAASVAEVSGLLTFTATGGMPPYSYSVIPGTGTGTINAATGVFSNGTIGDVTVRVTDSKGRTSNALIAITPTGAILAISPVNLSLSLGGGLTFVASGGTPPYTFTFLPPPPATSGSPTINIPGNGDYVAGLTPGIDRIQVMDGALDTAMATVNVTATPPTVDYSLTGFSIPSPVKGGSLVSGATFHVANGGIADGVEDIYYWVYLSDDGTLSSGDTLLDAGSRPALPLGPGTDVGINGTWPVSSGAKSLFVVISAVDDINAANNASAALPVTLRLPNYQGALVWNSGQVAGESFAATLSIDNLGPEDGAEDVIWTVYASLGDTAVDANDKIVAADSISGGMAAAAAPAVIPVSNSWPLAAGSYFLVAEISAADETDSTGNRPDSGAVGVTLPPVDYIVTAVNNAPAGPTRGGGPLSGQFFYRNNGSSDGAQGVHWIAYVSTDPTLDVGVDPVIDSGDAPALAKSTTSPVAVDFGGTWPAGAGDRYLFVAVSAGDDLNPGNNTTPSAAIAVGITDYSGTVTHFTPGGTTAGAGFTFSLKIDNVSGVYARDGAQNIYWNVYASLGDAAISVDDKVVGSDVFAGGLPAGDSYDSGVRANTWPATPGTYYLVADIFAADDPVTANNRPNTSVLVTAPLPPNYAVSFSTAPPLSALVNTAIAGQIRIQNISGNGGLQPINYSIYRSADRVLGGDVLLRSGTQAPLASGGSVDLPAADGDLWPLTGQFCFLIAVISAADDTDLLNNTFVSSPTGVANSIFTEEAEPYNNGDSGPPFNDVSTLPSTIPLNGTVAIEGLMDAFNLWDSYEMRMAAGATRLRIKARWNTGFDDLDLYFSTSSAAYSTTNASIETDPDTEPPGDTVLGFMSLGPATDYELGVNFWLANDTSGSTGREYVLLLIGLP